MSSGRGDVHAQQDESVSVIGALDILKELVDLLRQDGTFAKVTSRSGTTPKLQPTLVSDFCLHYATLPPSALTEPWSERQEILRFLAVDCAIDQQQVSEAVETYNQQDLTDNKNNSSTLDHSPARRRHTSIERLREACTPLHESVIRSLLASSAQGLSVLVAMRADLLQWLPLIPSDDDNSLLLRQLESHLRTVLATCLSPGWMRVERITYEQTPAAVMEQIAKHEAVHPIKNLNDLRQRLGPERRVFGLYYDILGPVPLVVLHVALQPEIPSTMQQVREESSQHLAKTATFYSISNLQAGLAGIGLGEYLIKQAVAALQEELPQIEAFATLSPLPRFRKWLEERVSMARASSKFASENLVPDSELTLLGESMHCTKEEALTALLNRLSPHSAPATSLENALSLLPDRLLVQKILTRIVARYLIIEKYRGKPLDGVGRFHLSNGATLARINWAADLSNRGWQNSLGFMVNYRYDLDRMQENQRAFMTRKDISVEAAVRDLLEYEEE